MWKAVCTVCEQANVCDAGQQCRPKADSCTPESCTKAICSDPACPGGQVNGHFGFMVYPSFAMGFYRSQYYADTPCTHFYPSPSRYGKSKLAKMAAKRLVTTGILSAKLRRALSRVAPALAKLRSGTIKSAWRRQTVLVVT